MGSTDPVEAEKWLKRTERVLNMMQCTPDEKFYYVVSLLQGNAYDWWETVPNATVQPRTSNGKIFFKNSEIITCQRSIKMRNGKNF